MKILLAHNSLYFPSHGGGDKSNRLLMEALAARGHSVEVFARLEDFSEAAEARFLADLAERNTPVQAIRDGGVCFEQNGVSVFTATTDPRLRIAFGRLVEQWDPDVILCSTDDPGALLLEVALRAPRARVVYLVRATVAVPFGPDCAFPNRSKTAMIGRVDSIVGVSEYVARYVRQWGELPAIHAPISLLEHGDYSAMGHFENEFVLMVNPCAVKGISIFIALAEAMPCVQFAAVPTWGTNPEDLALLRRFSNIRVFEPVDDIAVLLRRTRAVLAPSLWAEARSRMVVEAMIRGIPVIASDTGGLREAKLGVEYVLPVNPIQHYRASVDANMVPIADVPPQNIEPWVAALGRLLTERAHYEDVSRRSRAAAIQYAETLHSGRFEAHLEELIETPRKTVLAPKPAALSPAKERLLALRLERQKRPVQRDGDFLPLLETAKRRRRILFCFPWAGAGISPFRIWIDAFEGTGVCPIRLPGRETRLHEPAISEMDTVVRALLEGLAPHLDRPFAFYGHSMGAGIAFELARALRRENRPLPEFLFMASAKAPQLRTHGLEHRNLTDAELARDLDAAGALPADPAIRRLAFPVLRADADLYGRYAYAPEEPLATPIHAFRGMADPSLTSEQVQGWREQTTTGFSFLEVTGGHLFPLDDPQLLRVLSSALVF